jgi:hypothetical protein
MTFVFKSFKALFTSFVAFWAFPASVLILHHHSWQSPDVPLICGLWSLKEIDLQNNPKQSGSFIRADFKNVTPNIMGKQKGFEICVKTEIMFGDEDETVGILSEYA